MNAHFANGDVSWIDQPAAAELITDLQSGHNPPRAERLK
jgi:hypothetical protein